MAIARRPRSLCSFWTRSRRSSVPRVLASCACPAAALVVYLGVFAGVLLYIGAVDALPTASRGRAMHRHPGLALLPFAGAAAIYVVAHLIGGRM